LKTLHRFGNQPEASFWIFFIAEMEENQAMAAMVGDGDGHRMLLY